MKKTILFQAIFIFTIISLPTFAQSSQVFHLAVDNSSFGTIKSAGAEIDASGNVVILPGGTARFYLTAASGYEPSGFYVNGQFTEGAIFEQTVELVTSPISVIGAFSQVRDIVCPAIRIVSPAVSGVLKSGEDNATSIVFWVSWEGMWENRFSLALYRNDVKLQLQPVIDANQSNYRYKDVPLLEGDNLFMLKASDNADQSIYSVDFALVHYSSSGFADEARAAILIDERLYSQPGIGERLEQYAVLAAGRMAGVFGIFIDRVSGIDDFNTDQVREHIAGLKNYYKALEGVLLVGNIKLPSFHDIGSGQSRLFTQKYEDLGVTLENRLGSQADYDYMEKGGDAIPDLWCAVMPVGFDGLSENNQYSDFAGQLAPYLDKLVMQYDNWSDPYFYYQVSNEFADLNPVAYEWGTCNLFLYSVNDTGFGPYDWYSDKIPELYYRPMDTLNTWDFSESCKYYRRFPPIGEGWQSKENYTRQMDSYLYSIVRSDVPSNEGESIVTAEEAGTLTYGGIIQLLDGDCVAGFRQYGSASYVDTQVFPEGNILCGYVYGSSACLTASGCSSDRLYKSHTEKLSGFLANGAFAGNAHFFRRCLQYHNSAIGEMASREILVGDPFARVGYQFDGEFEQPSAVSNLTCTGTTSSSIALQWDASTDDSGISSYYIKVQDPDSREFEYWVGDISFVITSLVPGTAYSITIRSIDYWGNTSEASQPIIVTTGEGSSPAAPSGLICSSKTATCIIVQWNPSEAESGISSYQVYVESGDQGHFTNWTSDTYMDLWLTPNTSCSISVQAVDNNGVAGLWAGPLIESTNEAIPPAKPANLQATEVTENSISLSWDPPEDPDVFGYSIIAFGPDGSINSWGWWSETESVIMDYLPSGCMLTIKVQACDTSYIYGEWSDPLLVMTAEASPPTVPENLRVTVTGDTYVAIEWDASSDNVGVSGYTVEYSSAFNGPFTLYTSQTSINVNGLTPDTQYTFRVQAYDDPGNPSGFSSPLVVITNPPFPPATPQGLAALNVTETSITIGWNASGTPDIYGYNVSMTNPDGSQTVRFAYTSPVVFSGLTPDTTCSFRVQAIGSSGGLSEWSEELVVATLPAPPDWTPEPPPTEPPPTSIPPTSIPPTNPPPTPVPTVSPSVQGQAWISPVSQSVSTGADVTIEIHVNTGSAYIGAFGMTVTYPSSMFSFTSINEIASGLNLVHNASDPGMITFAGFNTNGIPGSSDIALLRITLYAAGSGTGIIGLSVESLVDPAGVQIGSPSGTAGTITIGSATPAPTALPSAIPTVPPTAAPTTGPTIAPTPAPTGAPTGAPTAAPTAPPTAAPTIPPTSAPTAAPTPIPTPGGAPSACPTKKPYPTWHPYPTHHPRHKRSTSDLRVLPIEMSGTPVFGQTIVFASGIVNKGKADSQDVKVKWIINGKTEYSARYEKITAGSVVKDGNTTLSWAPRSPGVYKVSFMVDTGSKRERNRAGNSATITVVVKRR